MNSLQDGPRSPNVAESPKKTKFRIPSKSKQIDDLLARIWRPVKQTTPDEWGAANRIYPETSGVPGPRDPWLTPYMVAFGRSVAGRTRRKVLMCVGAQMGKTDMLLDIMGQRISQRPVPVLYVGPNKQFLNEQFEPRLMTLLDEAPSLMAKVARGKRMTKTRKLIGGVPLRLAHAGSSTALKSDPFGLAITDEADELMANIKNQGDPIGLVDARGNTYKDFVHAIVSTPSRGLKETELDERTGLRFWKMQEANDLRSPIWKGWQQGTRHHWTWLCPSCTRRFVPRFDCFHFEGKDDGAVTPDLARKSAYVACPNCGTVLDDSYRKALNKTGRHVAPGQTIDDEGEVHGEPTSSGAISFWVSGLCSPFQTFGDLAASYAEAMLSGDEFKVQTAMNTGFGELWSPSFGDAPEWAAVRDCSLPYRKLEIPEGVLFLTAGVDVQKRKLVYVVRGWGHRQESWLIDYGELHGSGDTRLDDVWVDLWDKVLAADYGNGLRVARAFIDSGFRPDDPAMGDVHKVYEFCRRHKRLCYPTKGWDYRRQPVSVSHLEVTPAGNKPKFGIDVVHLDSDFTKEWVHSRVQWPKDQPGGWHVPLNIDEEFCRQITNEGRMLKKDGGHVWISRGPHDYLDAEAMAYAAARMLGLERIADTAVRPGTIPPPSPVASAPPSHGGAPGAAAQPIAGPPARTAGGGWLGGRTQNWLRR